MRPAEAVEFAYVDEFAHRAIGLACVKHDFAFEAHGLHHKFAEFADGEFLARAHVDVAVADFTEFRDSAAAASTVVAVNSTIDACAIMHARVFLDADDVAKIHVQKHMDRSVCHVFAPEEFAERLARAPKRHLVVLDTVLGEDFQDFILRGVTVDAFDGAFVHIDLDALPVVVVDELGQINLAHHGRHHVAVFQVEVVVRSVKVCGHHGDVVGAILQVVAFAHLEARNFRNGVFLVRVFEFACEERVFFHGLRSIFRINAGRAKEQKLLNVVCICLAEHVALDFHVHHHEIGTVERVRHNAADKGRREHNGIRAFLVKKFLDSVLVR